MPSESIFGLGCGDDNDANRMDFFCVDVTESTVGTISTGLHTVGVGDRRGLGGEQVFIVEWEESSMSIGCVMLGG